MNFSAAKLRSANWLPKKMPSTAAMAKALPTSAIWIAVKPSIAHVAARPAAARRPR